METVDKLVIASQMIAVLACAFASAYSFNDGETASGVIYAISSLFWLGSAWMVYMRIRDYG